MSLARPSADQPFSLRGRVRPQTTIRRGAESKLPKKPSSECLCARLARRASPRPGSLSPSRRQTPRRSAPHDREDPPASSSRSSGRSGVAGGPAPATLLLELRLQALDLGLIPALLRPARIAANASVPMRRPAGAVAERGGPLGKRRGLLGNVPPVRRSLRPVVVGPGRARLSIVAPSVSLVIDDHLVVIRRGRTGPERCRPCT